MRKKIRLAGTQAPRILHNVLTEPLTSSLRLWINLADEMDLAFAPRGRDDMYERHAVELHLRAPEVGVLLRQCRRGVLRLEV
jgi:hypothetical protein